MLIRSVDKTILANTNTIDCFYVGKRADKYVVTVRANDDDLVMAEYKTEEEAKEALEKLFLAYDGLRDVFDFSDLDS